MAFNQQHMVLQWSGTFRQGTPTGPLIELFTGSMRFGGPGVVGSATKDTAITLATVLQRYWATPAAQIPPYAILDSVKWNLVNTDGLYVSENTTLVDLPATPGAGSTGPYPLQVSWATTWATDVVRGKACRGRTYWPTTVSLQPDLAVLGSQCLAKANADSALISDLNKATRRAYFGTAGVNPAPQWAQDLGLSATSTADATGPVAMVMSRIGAGTSRVITHAEVGNRLDIQRRRANSQSDRRYSSAQ